MSRILILEDDEAIADIERDYLEMNDFEVHVCYDGVTGIEEALTGKYDLILIDIMLPGRDGLFVCKKLREQLNVPMIMVTAKHEDATQITALGLGADDYITKPFEPSVLVARVKAHLKQAERYAPKVRQAIPMVICGEFRADEQSRRIFRGEEEIRLKNKEYELLLFFMKNHDQVFTKEDLYEEIWGMDSEGESATVAVHVNRLRQKLEDDPANPEHIVTVWGVGYRFCG